MEDLFHIIEVLFCIDLLFELSYAGRLLDGRNFGIKAIYELGELNFAIAICIVILERPEKNSLGWVVAIVIFEKNNLVVFVLGFFDFEIAFFAQMVEKRGDIS